MEVWVIAKNGNIGRVTSLCLYLCLSICLSVCISLSVSLCLSPFHIYLSSFFFIPTPCCHVFLCLCLSFNLSISPFVALPIFKAVLVQRNSSELFFFYALILMQKNCFKKPTPTHIYKSCLREAAI